MVTKKKFDSVDGVTSRFLSDFIIQSEQFARVYNYFHNPAGVEGEIDPGTGLPTRVLDQPNAAEDLVTLDKWDLVDNSILFYTDPVATSSIWLEVATTPEEFGETLVGPSVERAEIAAAEAEASAAAALVSETNAAASEAAADADATQTALDVIATNADVVLTNADVIATNADVVLTNADVLLTHADVVSSSASAAAALVSENAAAISETNAAASAVNASNSESSAATYASNALNSENGATASEVLCATIASGAIFATAIDLGLVADANNYFPTDLGVLI